MKQEINDIIFNDLKEPIHHTVECIVSTRDEATNVFCEKLKKDINKDMVIQLMDSKNAKDVNE